MVVEIADGKLYLLCLRLTAEDALTCPVFPDHGFLEAARHAGLTARPAG